MSEERNVKTNQDEIQPTINSASTQSAEEAEIDRKLIKKNRIVNLFLLSMFCSFIFFGWILTHSDFYENHPDASNPAESLMTFLKEALSELK
jgi:glycerol uptake facilitator-like aquaporin